MSVAIARAASVALSTALLCLFGCASGFAPTPIDDVPFRERAIRQSDRGVTVTVAVPDRGETGRLFGGDLYARGIQPIWIEIENARAEDVTFLPVGLDPEYFTPIEAAYRGRVADPEDLEGRVARYFFDQGMSPHVPAGGSRSGFVFTRLDEGTKVFNVDILGEREAFFFSFFVPVPGLRVDHTRIDWQARSGAMQTRDLDRPALARWLQGQPCCTTDAEAKDSGDPLNIVVIGQPEDVYVAFMRAGWDETETIHGGSLWKTAVSFVGGGEYRYSPVSGLYVFGRPQDVAFQKARGTIHERNHLRLWMSDVRTDGKPVWLGQISRDIGVRLTRRTITTHKIDPDVDETREYLLEDLAYSQSLAAFAYAGGVGSSSYEEPGRNLTGDPYFTDGRRVVLWISSDPIAIDRIEPISWEAR